MARLFLSFDAESDGLYGRILAIGAVLTCDHGCLIEDMYARSPDTLFTDPWVIANVLPAQPHNRIMPYNDMIETFANFYNRVKSDAAANGDELQIVVHMGYIVEALVIREMQRLGFMAPCNGPFPLFDVADALYLQGFDPTSVDSYLEAQGRVVGAHPGFEKVHNPVYDALATAVAWAVLTRHKRDHVVASNNDEGGTHGPRT